jgi:GTP-binding protein
MFIDEVEIEVKAGAGGNGIIAFRREKYVPRGGPSGGDGGKGGSVVLLTDGRLTTLIDYRYKHSYQAERGKDGGPNCMTGAGGADLVLNIPVGTQVYDADTGGLLADLVVEGQKAVVAQGGRGGWGNARFATPVRRTPRYAENGEPGEHRRLRLELKLLADVGIIGFPNVGKSTLIARVSAARPKIADYPFTTLVPNLGVVRVDERRSFVMADIPGLIEGAHAGAGLGDRFLRHVERTRMLVHMLDVSGLTGRDPADDFDVVNRELRLYNPELAGLPQVVALNKIDVSGARDHAEKLAPTFQSRGFQVYLISAATGEGVPQLVYFLADELEKLDKAVPTPAEAQEIVRISPAALDRRRYEAKKVGDHEFVVEGKGIERTVAMTNLSSDETVRRLHRKLDRLGVIRALKDLGIEDGDTVRIGAVEFDYASDDEVQ